MKIASVKQYSNNINFNGWDEKKLNILGRNEEQMKELGLIFQATPYHKLYEVSKVHRIIGTVNHEKTIDSFVKLIEAVDAVKEQKANYRAEIKALQVVAKLKKKLAQKAEQDIKILSKKIKDIEARKNQYDDYYTPDIDSSYDSEQPEAQTLMEATDWMARI